MNPKTPRALVPFSAILLVLGVVIMDLLAGLFILVLAGILASIALAFGSKGVCIFAILWPNRRWSFGQGHWPRGHLRLRQLLLIVFACAAWKYPDARRHLERYRSRALASRQSIALPQGASSAMRLPLTGRRSNIINTFEAIILLVRNATASVITEDAAFRAADFGLGQIPLTEVV